MTVALKDTALVEPSTLSTDIRLAVTHAQKEMTLFAKLVGTISLKCGTDGIV